MPTTPPRLVSNAAQVRTNHAAFQQAMASTDDRLREPLIEVIPYIRSWIATRDPASRRFLFSSSKFVGYYDMNAVTYAAHHNDMDGRQTERVIAPWVRRIDAGSKDYAQARDDLFEFCAAFGKKPNGRCRISLLVGDETESEGMDSGDRSAALPRLLVEVFKTLPPDQQREVARQIGRL